MSSGVCLSLRSFAYNYFLSIYIEAKHSRILGQKGIYLGREFITVIGTAIT